MKSKSQKRIGALFLSLALCLSMLPTTAFAASSKTVNSASELRNAVNSAASGDTITLGADITLSAADVETVEGVYKFSHPTQTLLSYDHIWQRRYDTLGVPLSGWSDWSYRKEWGEAIDNQTGRFWDDFNRVNVNTNKTVRWLDADGYTIHYAPGGVSEIKEPLDATCGLLVDGKSITLNLGGHTLKGNGGDKAPLYSLLFVRNNGSVTITGTGTMDGRGGTAVTAYGETVKVTINSGNFKGDVAAVASFNAAEVAITGGTFQGPNWTERRFSRTVDKRSTSSEHLADTDNPYDTLGKFAKWRRKNHEISRYDYTMYGGTLYTEANGRFTISGNPTFTAPEGGTLIYNQNSISPGTVTIEGGTFIGKEIIHNDPGPEFPQISGGTFTTIPHSSDLKDYRKGTYAVFGTADGRYTIQPAADAAAKVKSGNQEASYKNLSDALANVKDGETVTLLKDHNQPVTLSKNSNYTLDLGGKAVSNSITASTGTVTIQNGTVNYTGTGTAVATSGSARLTVNCTVNANSGTALSASGGTLTVTSGTYWGKLSASGGTLSLTGGKYSADPSNYLLEGSYAEKGSDGLYSIKVGLNDSGYMEIRNAADLRSFAAAVNNNGGTKLNAILMGDIDLQGIQWTPIASYDGTFDGNGYSINNLNVHVSGPGRKRVSNGIAYIPEYAGLFAFVGTDGTIQNLNIGSGTVYGEITDYGDVYVGAIAGGLQGKIVNCSNSANVTASGKGRQTYVGGIVGSGGTIERCHNSGPVTIPSANLFFTYAGGIAGRGQLSNCYNTGAVSVKGTGDSFKVSGIGGTNSSSTYNTGKLSVRNDTKEFSVRHGSTYYLSSLAASENENATPKTAQQFASGEVAYLLNGSKEAPNGPWYQNLTSPNRDRYPVLDPTHAAVYLRDKKYVNANFTSISNPTITTDGGISLVELVSKLPKTVEVTSTIGTSTANVTWNTDNINYDPEGFSAQIFQITGTANVTGLLNGGKKPVTATVNVKAVTVTGLTVTTAPNLTYSQGGKLGLGNVRVTASLSNGKAQIVEHDAEGMTFALGGQTIADGAVLDKAQHNGQTLTLSYGGQTVDLGTLVVKSSNNLISSLTVSGHEAQYENGGYAVTLPPRSALPTADGIAVTLADASATVTGKTQLSAGDSEAQWQITVRAENGDTASYLLTVTVSPDYELLNQTAVDEFTAAWNRLTKSWTPTQAQVQQDTTTAGVEYRQQLTSWLTSQLLDNGVDIPDNATVAINYTSGPNWAVEGSRQDHDGTPGSFAFTLTFTATAGEDSQHRSVSFEGNAGTITPTPYNAPSYTVNFEPQNGTAASSVQVTEDTPIGNAARPADPSRENYRFTGWYKEASCQTPWNFDEPVTDNMTLYAGWRWSQSSTGIDVKRTQAANKDAEAAGAYGNGLRMGDTVTITAQATLTEEPSQTNTRNAGPEQFAFYLGDPANNKLLGEVTAMEQNGVYAAKLEVDLTTVKGFAEGRNTVYAVFSGGDGLDGSRDSESLNIGKAMFTVTFSDTGDDEIENQYVEDGQTASRPSDPTRTDYRFTGWTDADGNPYAFSTSVTGPVELTAEWEWAKSETGVSIRLEQAGNQDAPTETGVYHIGDDVSIHATVQLAEPPAISNSLSLTPDQFAFYVGDPDNGGTLLGTVDASADDEGGYTATLDNITLGTTEGLTDVDSYDIYAVFTGSNELNTSREQTSLTVRPRLYTVTFDSDGGSTTDPQYVEDGETIQEPGDPTRQDYRFTGWMDENGIPYDFSTTVTSPVELTAAWEWSKSETGVSIQWQSAGNDAAGENGTPIRMGDTVSVTASVELAAPSNAISLSLPYFTFYVGDPDNGETSLEAVDAQQTESGYTASLDVELTNGNGFTKAGTYAIYAVFSGSGELDGSRSSHGLEVAPAIYTVTFDSSGGTPVPPQYIVDGKTITEPEDPTKDGYHFGGWKQGERLWNFQRDTVAENMTLSAAWGYVPVFDITGSVTDDKNQPLPNVEITLQQGKDVVFETVTNEQGQYKFEKVSPGLYNIVAERTVEQSGQQTKQTVTSLVEIIDADKTPPTLKMPPANVSSVLEVPENAPNIVVGGLTEEAIDVAKGSENQGAAVTVNMTVEPKAPVTGTPADGSNEAKLQREQQAIQQQAASRTLNFLEIAVVKTVGTDKKAIAIKETKNLLEIAVAFDFTNRGNVTVYRYHNGQAQALTQVNARAGATDGTYYLDRENGLIHIFTQQFSLYAIGYTVPTPGGNGGGGNSSSGGGGSPSYAVDTDAKTDHGTVTVKPSRAEKGDTVTITAKPDEGYQVGKVTVTDKNGDTIKVTDKGDGKYTFTMPGGKVSVDVTFAAEKQWANPFADVPEDAWYYDGMKFVYENGLMAGTSGNTFSPNVTTTRGMLVTILYRLAGSPNIEDEIWGYPFQDVDATAYYAAAVYWARMNGIVAGYSDERFGPSDTITREQMATILHRYAQYKGYDTTDEANLSKYTDAAQVGSYAVEAIRWANAEGLVNGTGDTTLTPKGSATRAQVAVILTRFCQNIAK